MVVEVKESVPVAEKKPLMESAWAIGTLLKARAESIARRFSIVWSPGLKNDQARNFLARLKADTVPI